VLIIVCYNLVLFCYYNKVLLDFCLAHVVFLFVFFLFRDLNLELSMLMFSFWFKKSYRLYCFVSIHHVS
jgi:hypothetical protein